MYKGYLIDLDGTAYTGQTPIKQTISFVEELKKKEIPYLFLTNNASKSVEQVAEKLNNMGYQVKANNIYTSADATITFIKEKYSDKTIYNLGDVSLTKALKRNNISVTDDEEKANMVVVGYNEQMTYLEIAKACTIIQKGAIFVSTNPDLFLPNEKGIFPGNGAITKMIETVCKTKAIIIGKPENIILEYAIKKLSLKKDDVVMIGDNYDTDICLGINNGVNTIFVETGVHTMDEVKQKEKQPTHLLKDLSYWNLND